jgi:ArsR family metal-binding transcriptional regulator
MLIEDYDVELDDIDCLPEAQGSIYSAKARFSADVSEVMPYLNAVIERAKYGSVSRSLIWKDGNRVYALRPDELAVSGILDMKEARQVVAKTVGMINEVWEKRSEITPSYEERTQPPALEAFKLLPGTNCGECGVASCMAFAVQLTKGDSCIEDCPALLKEDSAEAVQRLKRLGLK